MKRWVGPEEWRGRAFSIMGTIDAGKYGELFRRVIAPLQRALAGKMSIQVNITVTLTSAIPPATKRQVEEAASQMGLTTITYEAIHGTTL